MKTSQQSTPPLQEESSQSSQHTLFGHMAHHIELFACPRCRGGLKPCDNGIVCSQCAQHYRIDNGIPLLFCPNEWDASKSDVTDITKAFYEETPFPNYEECENVNDLVQKAQNGLFARLLNEQIPFNVPVLEVGCGTGQLTNFLAVAQRTVFGVDMCLNSLKLGQAFRQANGLTRAGFYQMNLFRPIFRREAFPLVICNGVLHHTSDPFAGFQSIAQLVQSGGYILIGLYNHYGRIITDLRRLIFRFSGDRFKFLDPRLRTSKRANATRQAWFMDQYKHPHESKHTIGEVLRWFDQTGFEFVNAIPKLQPFAPFTPDTNLFAAEPRGNWLDHLLVQVRSILAGSREGGFFVMIGKKKG